MTSYIQPNIPDITISIKNLESKGILSIVSLLNIARFLKVSREVKEYFFADDIDLSTYTKIYDLFELIYTNKNIEDKIFSIILDENTIDDNASPKLSAIRKECRHMEQDIRDKLNSFIHSSIYLKSFTIEVLLT